MPQRANPTYNLMSPLVVLALPGMYLLYKYNQYRQQQMETARRRVTERELLHLNTKICPPPPVCKEEVPAVAPCLPKPEKPKKVLPDSNRPTKQVSIIGADTSLGQYVAFLLKQNPSIKRLRLYEASDFPSERDMSSVVSDLKSINTNCAVQGFSCKCPHDLDSCLQNTDVVLILESALVQPGMSMEDRFYTQAPLVKHYADVIAGQCPSAFVIVCASPIDCMVPLIAETLKEVNSFDARKLLGSLSVPEMRASTIAAQALSLEPKYLRVPCVGGTEGDTLVPLFSRAVEYFDFSEYHACQLTETVRYHCHGSCPCSDAESNPATDMSEAHAITGLVVKIVNSLLCHDAAIVTGFVECLPSQIISPLRYMANKVEISSLGICTNFGLPKMNDHETEWFNWAMQDMCYRLNIVLDYQCKCMSSTKRFDKCKFNFFYPRPYKRFIDTAYTFL